MISNSTPGSSSGSVVAQIEVGSLAQLDGIRYDLDADGSSTNSTAYDAAFPKAATGMGCPSAGCTDYELSANLDFDTNGNGEADAGDDYWNNGAGWEPIGTFWATFEGNSHVISGLYIDRSRGAVGLFGRVQGGEIRNLGLEGMAVKGGDSTTGGLIGSTSSRGSHDSLISASYVTGFVSGGTWVGGLVGDNWASIKASYVAVSVSGDSQVGGLVGTNSRVFRVNEGDILTGSISASYATGSVTAGRGFGGGLVGGNGGAITASYATSSLSGSFVGGLVGEDRGGVVSTSYWDTQTSGLSTSAGGEGKTTSELQSPTSNTGIYATWDDDV